MRALITGINGFVAGHLAEHLLGNDWEVAGLAFTDQVRWPSLQGRAQMVAANLLEPNAVRAALDATHPDVIFHLAAQAHVPTAHADPVDTISNNLLGQLHLLQAIRATSYNPLLIVACTSEEYGSVRPDDIPVDEDTPLRPNNPYAFSKVTQDMLALQYFLGYQVKTIRLRLFNHIGPRQSADYVVPAFAQQIARIEAGQQEPIMRVGNLEAQRDFTDVRDVARAYELAALHGEPGEVYNIGSGRPVMIRAMLNQLLSLSTANIDVVIDPARVRPIDVPIIACDASRFQRRTGWAPQISLERMLNDILTDWRERTQQEGEAEQSNTPASQSLTSHALPPTP